MTTSRTDGTALSLADIDGYRIHYGPSSGKYPDTANVTDGSAQSITVTDVPAGEYHVVMTTVDTDGLESGYSSEIIKTAQ
jgi:imidazole glycerol phosphate synthase subunit HisF